MCRFLTVMVMVRVMVRVRITFMAVMDRVMMALLFCPVFDGMI